MDNALLVPLTSLPGSVPAGAPLVIAGKPWVANRTWVNASEHRPGTWLRALCCEESDEWSEGGTRYLWAADPMPYPRPLDVIRLDAVALDLSPPTLTDGWPDRVDGAHVGASMLARAMGWPTDAMGIAVAVKTARDLAARFGVAIDPTDPNADRLALCAILRAQPWKVSNV